MRCLLACLLLSGTSLAHAQATEHDDAELDRPDPTSQAAPAAPDPAPSARPRADERVDEAALERALAELAHEPSVEQVVQATRSAGPRSQSTALARRARAAGWVPRLGLRARRGQGLDLSSAQNGDSLRLSTDDDLMLEASLSFELDRVVFRREEVALQREARAERRAIEERVRAAIEVYFERKRAQLEQRLRGPTPERALKVAELTALLDIFTDGAFSRMMASPRWRTDARTPATKPKSSPSSRSTKTR